MLEGHAPLAVEGGAVAVLVGSDWASPPEYCDLGLAIHFPLAAHTPQLRMMSPVLSSLIWNVFEEPVTFQ